MPLEQFLIYCYLRPTKVLNQQKLHKNSSFTRKEVNFSTDIQFFYFQFAFEISDPNQTKSLEFADEKCHQQNNHFIHNRGILTAHSLCKMFLIQTKGLYRDVSLFIIPSATRNSSSYTQQNK